MSASTVGSLDGRVALVTGAAMGIGRAISETFIQRGARVAIADIDGGAAQATAGELGDAAIGMACDVTRAADVDAAVQATVGRLGRLDIEVLLSPQRQASGCRNALSSSAQGACSADSVLARRVERTSNHRQSRAK